MSDFEFRDEPKEEVKAETEEGTINQLDTGTEFDEAELEAIYDSLMFDGKYTEEVSVGKRLRATFVTRTAKEAREVLLKIDKMGLSMGITVESIRGLYNLAQSLVAINDTDISGEPFDKKVDRIEVLPSQVVSKLMIALSRFDIKVDAAVGHGAENF